MLDIVHDLLQPFWHIMLLCLFTCNRENIEQIPSLFDWLHYLEIVLSQLCNSLEFYGFILDVCRDKLQGEIDQFVRPSCKRERWSSDRRRFEKFNIWWLSVERQRRKVVRWNNGLKRTNRGKCLLLLYPPQM